jgi:hypothetical protein
LPEDFEPPPPEDGLEPPPPEALVDEEPLLLDDAPLPLPEGLPPPPDPLGGEPELPGLTTFCTVPPTWVSVLSTVCTRLPTGSLLGATAGLIGGVIAGVTGGGVGTVTVGSPDVRLPTGPPSERASVGTRAAPVRAHANATPRRRVTMIFLSAVSN